MYLETSSLKRANNVPKLRNYQARLCCEKLGTSHDVKGFAICLVLEGIVVERANDDLCLKDIKNAGLVSAKPIKL